MARSARRVIVERLGDVPDVPLPKKATRESACFDLYSGESVRLRSGQVTLVRTGLKLRAPPGTFLEVRPRSGLSTRGVVMVNAPGTIDRDYAGEVKVPLTYLFRGSYLVSAGDRIGQLRLVEEIPTAFQMGRVGVRGDRAGGFGSTGR
jgi:dUTP pyrophosphatase